MAEEKKQNWWSSVPGLLTAATGLVAALSGLVAGLNQTGLLERFRAAQSKPETVAVVRTDSAPPRPIVPPESSAAEHTSAPTRAATPAPVSRPAPSTPAPSAPATTAPVTPAPAARAAVLPSGTVLELASTDRICSAGAKAGDRFTATLVSPVQGKGGATLPAGTKAVLSVQRLPAPNFIGARLDSLVTGGAALPVGKSDVRPRRDVVRGKGNARVGACIPEGGRIRATLRAPLKLPGA